LRISHCGTGVGSHHPGHFCGHPSSGRRGFSEKDLLLSEEEKARGGASPSP